MKKLLSLVLSMALMCTLIAGCGPKESENSGGEVLDASETTFGLTPLSERTTLTIGFFSGSAHSMPWYIADELGFFNELNIDVEYESFISGPAMMEASASWDICDVGAPGVLNGMKNYDVHMLGICDNEYNTALFVRPDSPQAADPTNPEVWKGIECILPTGTTLQYMFLSYLQTLGLSASDVTITNMDVTSALTAFNAGEGDALCVWNAVAYNAEDSGLVRITDVEQLGINNICGLAATTDALENKSDLIDLAWMVYYLTWDWCQQSEENMAKAVELYPPLLPGQDLRGYPKRNNSSGHGAAERRPPPSTCTHRRHCRIRYSGYRHQLDRYKRYVKKPPGATRRLQPVEKAQLLLGFFHRLRHFQEEIPQQIKKRLHLRT